MNVERVVVKMIEAFDSVECPGAVQNRHRISIDCKSGVPKSRQHGSDTLDIKNGYRAMETNEIEIILPMNGLYAISVVNPFTNILQIAVLEIRITFHKAIPDTQLRELQNSRDSVGATNNNIQQAVFLH